MADIYYTGLDVVVTPGLDNYVTKTCVQRFEGDDHSGVVDHNCAQWVDVYSFNKNDVTEIGAGIIGFGFAMVSIFFIILRVLKSIFNFGRRK